MEILRFNEFLQNFGEFLNESGIPFYRGSIIKPERTIKRNKLLQELKNFLGQVAEGKLTEVSVVAEIPTQGKNTPQYLRDIYVEMGMSPEGESEEEDDEDMYDPETDVYLGNRDRRPDDPKHNIFIDSEFIVKDVDFTKNVLIATPYSLKKKNILVEITPEMVDEVYVK